MNTEETMQSDHLSICQEANRQLRAEIESVKRQRGELLAEMKKIGILTSFESGTVDAQVFDIARAAIAKVKGEKQ